MSMELWAVVRDSIGLYSTVNYNGEKVLIKDLPNGNYEVYKGEKKILKNQNRNDIPGSLIFYCSKLEEEGKKFESMKPFEAVSSLEFIVKKL